jgi:hypothetical protein
VKVQLQKARYVGRLYAQRRYALSRANMYTYTYTIIRFFLTSVYAYLTLTAHPTADLHDGRTRIFDGGRVIVLSRDGRYLRDSSVNLGYGEYILLQFNEEEVINYDRQKHQAPLLENVGTST